MRTTLLLAILLGLFSYTSIAQDCKNYYYLQKNKTIEMTIYNRKGDVTGRQVYTVSDVTPNGTGATGTVESEMFDKKGKSIAKGHTEIACKNGVVMLDMKMQLQQIQEQYAKADAKADQVFIEYPADMKPGDNLKDATLNMTIDNGGMTQTVNMVTSNRKVESKESVTTPAGTWDCFKITFKSKVTIKSMGIGIPVNVDGTEWFAPGFGIVKTESKHGSTAITSIK